MNLRPLLGFYWNHGTQIETMIADASSGGKGSGIITDVAEALAPVVKKHWPALNANNLIDDTISTLKAVLAPDPVQTVDNARGGAEK